jgi:hypothetical protein
MLAALLCRHMLHSYAQAVDLDAEGDREYSLGMSQLANRSGLALPYCKRPD